MFFKGLSAFLQVLIDLIALSAKFVFSVLPPSPFTFIKHIGFGDLLAQVNYFVPVYEFVVIVEAWLVAVGVFYVYSLWARFVKAVE